ncbi:MAG: hypothetical protein ACR2RF_32725 [Geminicoccaceae bacterium]
MSVVAVIVLILVYLAIGRWIFETVGWIVGCLFSAFPYVIAVVTILAVLTQMI